MSAAFEARLGARLEALIHRAMGVATGSVSWDALVKAYAEAAGIPQKQAVRLFLERKSKK